MKETPTEWNLRVTKQLPETVPERNRRENRMLDEQERLSFRIKNLEAYLESRGFSELDLTEQDLLKSQLFHMKNYSKTLGYRLELTR